MAWSFNTCAVELNYLNFILLYYSKIKSRMREEHSLCGWMDRQAEKDNDERREL